MTAIGITQTLGEACERHKYQPTTTDLAAILLVLLILFSDCNIDNYELIHSREQVIAKSMCTVIKSHFKKDNASECGEYTCYHLGNAFNFKVH